ncbi:GNAT family N-acetyltransferase [Rhodococcus sp. NBC_00294]|uniref:GNAT family N-acetyltransferase n=1 Tax=Rhodococcus sp. NBC_00294 TaxID=2976004 RepID=UPI002E2E0349|nr:GNAT family N-acetyltransferase [Rhodococcus sp. NBC_00294]
MAGSDRPQLEVARVDQGDPLARPLLAALAIEYSTRYGGTADQMYSALSTHPAEDFAPPHGGLIVLLENGEPVAGGAFRRHDEQTAELKRIWTSASHRRRGLARRVLTELESEIAVRNYKSIHLTTGWRQPEAVGLYLAAGYTPLFDPVAPPAEGVPRAFRKTTRPTN